MTFIKTERVHRILSKTTSIGATTAWLTMALVTFVDVVGRELFSAPIRGGYEIIQAMMAVGIFFSLPIVTLNNGHVKVELFRKLFPPGFRIVSDGLARLSSVIFFGFFAFSLIRFTMHTNSTGIRTAYLSIPLWVVGAMMSVFLVVATVCGLIARDSDQEIDNEEEV